MFLFLPALRADAATPLTSSHSASVWSNDRTVSVEWGTPEGATEFSYVWDSAPATDPDIVGDGDPAAVGTVSTPLGDGKKHWFHLRILQDGTWSDTQHLGPFWMDDTDPAGVGMKGSALSRSVQRTNRFTIAWGGSDATSGVSNYDVRWRRRKEPGGTYSTSYTRFRSATESESGVFQGSLGYRYCFGVRARDAAGNSSPWSANRCTTIPSDAEMPHPTCGDVGQRVVRFRVFVETGLGTTKAEFADRVERILCDRRSWIRSGRVRFRYDPDGPLLIGLRDPGSTERRCRQLIGLSVRYYFSCATAREVVLNSGRWFGGSKYLSYSVKLYRRLLVNHEVGHTQGLHHATCPRSGSPAPVMMQQSKGLRGCSGNVWPLAREIRLIR